jgi:hypothetical protein
MSSIGGNRAVKVTSGILTDNEQNALFSREGFIYWSMLNTCDGDLRELSQTKNIDVLEYNTLFSQKCARYEKLFYGALRSKMREKMYDDQIKEFSTNYDGIYHPYNPYLQKYNGDYLRTYQLFD